MKKYMLILILTILSAGLYAQEITPDPNDIRAENGIIKAEWSAFQFGLYPDKYGQLYSAKTDIYGLAIGVFLLEQQSAVISVGLTSRQFYNYGIQCAAVNITDVNYGLGVAPMVSFIDRNYGVQVGICNVEAEGLDRKEEYKGGAPGLQIGVLNIGQGFQIGALNYNTNAYIPILPIFNFSK